MSNTQNNALRITDEFTKEETFNFEPLRKAIYEDHPTTMVKSLDNALFMLASVNEAWFTKRDIVSAYYDLRQLRDAIVKGGKSCQ